MITNIRQAYNQQFSAEKYQAFLEDVYQTYQHQPAFRISETPIFIPELLKNRLIEACEEIMIPICQPNFKELSKAALHPSIVVPNEDEHTVFLQMDFGIVLDENGDLMPQLIEVQGFPSLYFFQLFLAQKFRQHFDFPKDYSPLLGGITENEYIEQLRRIIIGDSTPESVVLLEIEPEKQATRIDFLVCERYLGLKVLCVSDLIKEGKDLYYHNESGQKIAVERLFFRSIFDELLQRPDLERQFSFKDEINAEWVGHPNWFYRISKHTLPLLDSKYVPKSYYLHELEELPEDLHNYVLKPLFSFSGAGVKINVTKADIDEITNPENYLLQRKVTYAPVIEAPGEPVKCEIRMLMLWEKGTPKPVLVNNLARLSKGEMIGVRYNKDKDWVGASVGFFE